MKTKLKKLLAVLGLVALLGRGSVVAAAPASAFPGFAYTVTCPAGTKYQYVRVVNMSGATIAIRTSNGTSYAQSYPRPNPHYHYTWARTTTYYFSGSGSWNWSYQFYCQS